MVIEEKFSFDLKNLEKEREKSNKENNILSKKVELLTKKETESFKDKIEETEKLKEDIAKLAAKYKVLKLNNKMIISSIRDNNPEIDINSLIENSSEGEEERYFSSENDDSQDGGEKYVEEFEDNQELFKNNPV